jgi:uncharacterized protein (TIGR02996 family)
MTLADWCGAVDKAPGDVGVRLVWADWLEEDGKALEAECLRWAAAEGRGPHGPWPRGLCSWSWFSEEDEDPADYPWAVGDGLFGLLDGWARPEMYYRGKYYPSPSAAWLALTDAYRRWKCPTP